MTQDQPWDRQAVHDELNRVQADFRRLLAQATPATLARRTSSLPAGRLRPVTSPP